MNEGKSFHDHTIRTIQNSMVRLRTNVFRAWQISVMYSINAHVDEL